ncbi:MAG: sodium-dependent transporter, partial [Candidatus Zixiibacteriota bacterium]
LLNEQAALNVLDAGDTGLSFVWLPQLFEQMPFGAFLSMIFFLALFIAALSSLIAMVELSTRILMDFGLQRRGAVLLVWAGTFLLGIPSALSMSFFNNQDWAWGVGLLVSGFFFALAVNRVGAEKFRTQFVNTAPNDMKVGKWYTLVLRFVIPIEFGSLLIWWFYKSIVEYEPGSWWNPFKTYSLSTCLLQWGIAIGLFLLFNQKLVANIHEESP